MQTITVSTSRRAEMVDVTAAVERAVSEAGVSDGTVTVYVPHTTAGITINEGADPAVAADILAVLDQLVPWEGDYRHREGNSAAHVKASLMGSTVTAIVRGGRLRLGTWQRIFFCEFDGPRRRQLYLHWQRQG